MPAPLCLNTPPPPLPPPTRLGGLELPSPPEVTDKSTAPLPTLIWEPISTLCQFSVLQGKAVCAILQGSSACLLW